MQHALIGKIVRARERAFLGKIPSGRNLLELHTELEKIIPEIRSLLAPTKGKRRTKKRMQRPGVAGALATLDDAQGERTALLVEMGRLKPDKLDRLRPSNPMPDPPPLNIPSFPPGQRSRIIIAVQKIAQRKLGKPITLKEVKRAWAAARRDLKLFEALIHGLV
jgi:hypothetical protein